MFVLAFWSIGERQAFLRLDGKLNRGVRLTAQPLTSEMRQFLEKLPASVYDGRRFVRKQGAEILIGEEHPWWRRGSWYYMAYTDLSTPDNSLEFRVARSTLVSSLASFLLAPLLFFAFIFESRVEAVPSFFFVFLGFMLLASPLSFYLHHWQAKRRLLGILHQAMSK